MAWEVSDEVLICASHQILEADGTREPDHGHNWRIRAFLEAMHLDDRGLVMDFRVLKAMLWDAVAPFDHHDLNQVPEMEGAEPTAEELGRIVFHRLEALIAAGEWGLLKLDRIEIWMTDTGCATYRPAV